MEGPLSKWTNVVHGWQYRWFVLGEDALLYYTSKEKMAKGQQRGCLRLRGAIVGIDGENNSLFTITVDGKIFHLQGRDQRERDQWVKALEAAIRACSAYHNPAHAPAAIRAQLQQAEVHLEAIKEQVEKLDALAPQVHAKEKRTVDDLLTSSNRLIEVVGRAVVLLQMAQSRVECSVLCAKENENGKPKPTGTSGKGDSASNRETTVASREPASVTTPDGSAPPPSRLPSSTLAAVPPESATAAAIKHHLAIEPMVAPISYSSSDDEFYDAEEYEEDDEDKQEKKEGTPQAAAAAAPAASGTTTTTMTAGGAASSTSSVMGSAGSPSTTSLDDDANEDYDAVYDQTEESDVGDVQQQHGSVLVHLLSQVSVGMDLTKVTLPTFILERRSLLEMYADFFAHPDSFILTPTLESPEDRFVSVVRYYLGAFYAARKSGVAKKPYNPILGESFRCKYAVPNMDKDGSATTDGPFPGTDVNEVTFVAEQVSHHPPISAFYAEHPGRRISFHANIYTKSSFLGLSIGVQNIGSGRVILHDLGEEYVLTFPSGYGRSIMSTPWVELGGKVKVTCEKTGYYADIDFLTKPFIGGKPHRISGNLFKEGSKKPFLVIRGEWNDKLYAKRPDQPEYLMVDVREAKESRKRCVPVMQQGDRESRKLWRHVTVGLLRNKISKATAGKREIEQRQRDEAKARAETGEKWVPKMFAQDDQERWYFTKGLTLRENV
ncbi:hypothetical protein PMAYCL1PPCAC_21565 [Pristionchus mayeri]|uniref:Oxysterol-binding protein n=1 Tax=Pristionchus mayeri TaxID=1317129 RepID=A0AAN5CW28_9BILA|nr:hypothetical protein PMAYCL1PPCAC_21565 [Pristionchus mayeri]